MKTVIIRTFWNFFQLRLQFEAFFLHKVAFISLKNTLGYLIMKFVSFNIQSHEIYRKFHKNFIKTVKNLKVLQFLLFSGQSGVFGVNLALI